MSSLDQQLGELARELIAHSLATEFHKRLNIKCSHGHSHGHGNECKETSEPLAHVNATLANTILHLTVTRATERYFRLLGRAKEDKTPPPSAEEAEMLRLEIFKEALVQEMVRSWETEACRRKLLDARDAGNVAHPGMVEKVRQAQLLNQLRPPTVHKLVAENWTIESQFGGQEQQFNKLYTELDRLHLLGNFRRVPNGSRQPLAQMSGDISIFDRALQPQARQVAEQLAALPFELNAKIASLHLNIATEYLVVAIDPKERIVNHTDNAGPENGRTVTALLIAGEAAQLDLSEDGQSTVLLNGNLVLLKSRRKPWGISNVSNSRVFVFVFFISGPPVPDW